jgi:hypothetical protein
MAAARDRRQLLGHNSAACCCATLMAALLLQQHWSASTLLARCGGRICRSPPTSTTCLRSPSVTRQAISIMVFFSMSRPAIFRGAVSTLNAAATACARRQCTWQPGRCRGAEALHNTAQALRPLVAWRAHPRTCHFQVNPDQRILQFSPGGLWQLLRGGCIISRGSSSCCCRRVSSNHCVSCHKTAA